MKRLPLIVWAVLSALAMASISPIAAANEVRSVPPTAPLGPGAAYLQTQPASVRTPSSAPIRLTPFTATDLNGATVSLQAKPPRAKSNSIIPDGLVNNAPTPNREVNPLEFFKVPALDSGVKVRVGQN